MTFVAANVLLIFSHGSSADTTGCWDGGGGFSPAYCCRGRGGRAECWDSFHSFERCCGDYLKDSHPFGDLLAARSRDRSAKETEDVDRPEVNEPLESHRRCVAAGSHHFGGVAAKSACAELEARAAEAAAAPRRGTQYLGVHYRLARTRFPFAHFVAPVHDLFYKAKTFPGNYWGSDDFALFEAGFRALLRCGDVAVDAGANIGGYTQMLALSVCASGRVHSFEPFRLTFQMLNANVALAGLVNVHTYHRALSNKVERSKAVGTDVRDPQQQTIWNSLVIPRESVLQNEAGFLWSEEEAEVEEIQCITLDSLALPRVDFMKIDVEAMEGHVILGALETIQRSHPSILVEVKGFQRQKIHTLLVRDLGYHCHSVLSTNPSDFFCAHPSRPRHDDRIDRVLGLWTTPALAHSLCKDCQRRGPAPVEVVVKD